jgi:hypothetical protein
VIFKLYARLALVGFLGVASLLHAHPGHDGHELTWDLSHGFLNLFSLLILMFVISAGICRLRRR